jgi:hypothetical protein
MAEKEVVVSSLTELETEVHLKAAALGGNIRASQWHQCQVESWRVLLQSRHQQCKRRGTYPSKPELARVGP